VFPRKPRSQILPQIDLSIDLIEVAGFGVATSDIEANPSAVREIVTFAESLVVGPILSRIGGRADAEAITERLDTEVLESQIVRPRDDAV